MKAELNIPSELASAIADEVVARLRPLITGLQRKLLQGNDLMGVVNNLGGVDSISRGEEQQGRQQTLPQVGYLRLKEVLTLVRSRSRRGIKASLMAGTQNRRRSLGHGLRRGMCATFALCLSGSLGDCDLSIHAFQGGALHMWGYFLGYLETSNSII